MSSRDKQTEKTGNIHRQSEEAQHEQDPPGGIEAMPATEVEQLLNQRRLDQIEIEARTRELHQAQSELLAQRQRYSDFYDPAPVGFLTLSQEGQILESNLAVGSLLNRSREALLKQSFTSFILPEDLDLYTIHRKQLAATGEPQTIELRLVTGDEVIFWTLVNLTVEQYANGTRHCRIVLSDITRRKHQEIEGECAARLVAQINSPEELLQRISDLVACLRNWSGCEAVGIRLQDGDDFPYIATRGFPAAFVEAENHLCAAAADGKILRDSAGDPVLECICGDILRGRFDPVKPYYTAKGSFCSNTASILLAGITTSDRKALNRNNCNGEGYQSVALIPLRTDNQVFGLLQFNDHRPNRFSPERFAHFERMADILAIALWRRQVEWRLRESEERFRSIVENSAAGYFFVDQNGLFKAVNTAWLRLHKYDSPAEILGRHFSVTQVEPDITQADTNVKHLLAGNALAQGEFTRLCRDGSIGWHTFSVNPVRQDGKVIGLEGFLIDITAHKQTEEALRQSEEKYRMVADFTYDMEMWRGPDGRYRYVSPSCKRVTGHTAAEFLADPDLMIIIAHPDDRPRVFNHYLKTIVEASNQDLNFEFRILTPEGTTRWLSHWCTPVFDQEGRWLGRRESNRDISKRKGAEKEKARIEDVNRQLQKAESLARMAGAIAHHFNNKLHVVMGRLEMVMSRLPPDDTITADLAAAMEAADKAADVSRMMLAYLGQVPGTREPQDLCEVCSTSLATIRFPLPNNLVLQTDLNSPGLIVKVNAHQISQILVNLITNAWEAIGDGQGTVSLSVKPAYAADISTEHRFPINWKTEDSHYACLEVRDSGCGMAAKDIEEIFSPFYSTKFTGRGLGLSVILGLVQAHYGVITVQSTLGQGSVFRVFLALSEEELHRQAADTTADNAPAQESGTVLLVDDDYIVLKITTEMLSRLGFTVLGAADGIEAVEMFREHQGEIRLVITDVAMPRMNGWETLSALRQIAPGIPIILSSGYSEEQVMDGSHPELPQAFLGKPYSLKSLKDAILRSLTEFGKKRCSGTTWDEAGG